LIIISSALNIGESRKNSKSKAQPLNLDALVGVSCAERSRSSSNHRRIADIPLVGGENSIQRQSFLQWVAMVVDGENSNQRHSTYAPLDGVLSASREKQVS